MKKIYFALLACALISCAGSRRDSAPRSRMIGFIGTDVLRIESTGTHSGTGTIDSRKREARERAVVFAKQYCMEIYSGNIMSNGSGYHPSSVQRFMRIVENGSVVSESYDGEGWCVLVYEIRSRNLREMLHGAVSTP